MICLFTKKGYDWFSGNKLTQDPRGFDIVAEGTHGTSGWMPKAEINEVVHLGKVGELSGTILGKLIEDAEDDDRYAEYAAARSDTGLNGYIILYGAGGSGKSRRFVDPKGELFESTSEHAREQGMVVKAFNLLDKEHSNGFNCLADIRQDNTLVQTIAETIIKNTSNASERQDFWEKAELNLLMALLLYIQDKRDSRTGQLLPIEERSLGAIYRMLSSSSFNQLEDTFRYLPPDHPAQAPYGIFKLANRQIWGNIAIGLGNRLSVFQDDLVDKITCHNDIDLLLPGQQPCIYYCIISAQDSSLEFLSSLFFSLLFTRLPNYARKFGESGRKKVPVNVMLEEFCNVGYLADFK